MKAEGGLVLYVDVTLCPQLKFDLFHCSKCSFNGLECLLCLFRYRVQSAFGGGEEEEQGAGDATGRGNSGRESRRVGVFILFFCNSTRTVQN